MIIFLLYECGEDRDKNLLWFLQAEGVRRNGVVTGRAEEEVNFAWWVD